jgi:2,3-bisphosphoglycerate-independent phosphoglycerate mutase
LFGYDPLHFQAGRGVLSALGIEFDLREHDVAARGNFCSLSKDRTVTDRRAGRISTEKNKDLCSKLREIKLEGTDIFIETVKEHRFLLVLRGEGLSEKITDTDPQITGQEPLPAKAKEQSADKTADLINQFITKAEEKLSDQDRANGVLLRGFAERHSWPSMTERYGLKSAAIAAYPMYRGVTTLIGMDQLKSEDDIEQEFRILKENWNSYDFFYVHFKHSDSAGEDGNFEEKIGVIEEVDKYIPDLMQLDPQVILATGDHSTPCVMQYHSWHPVPVLLWSPFCRKDGMEEFGEQACLKGSLGSRFSALDLMPLCLSHSGRLDKFGA